MERENRDDRGDEALNRLSDLALLVPGDPFVAAGRRRIALDWVARTRASISKGDLAGARQGLKKAGSIQPELPELAGLAATLQQAEAAERAREVDADEFAAARRANTRKAYWSYLEHCAATCNYRAEAEAALARLAPANPVMRDRLSDGSQGPEMVAIPAGSFLMGSPPHEKGRYNDEQQHPARIAKPFAIGKYEVMFYEYDRFAVATGKALPDDQGWGRGRRPVINVSWLDAEAYVEWLSQQTGYRYRLPTEAEWEYAARAGTAASRYWGDDPNQGCPYANRVVPTPTRPTWTVKKYSWAGQPPSVAMGIFIRRRPAVTGTTIMACTTCWATSWSGPARSTRKIIRRRRKIAKSRPRIASSRCEADRGTMGRATSVRRNGCAIDPTSGIIS